MPTMEDQRAKYNLNRRIKRLGMITSEETRAQRRKYYAEHREETRAQKKKYRAEHKEEVKAQKAKYRAGNIEKVKASAIKFRTINPEAYKMQNRKGQLKRAYGMTIEDYARMYDEQWGMCGICGTPGKSQLDILASPKELVLAVDHCHTTNKVRGLLCALCNKALGLFRDNEDFLEAGINYLKYFKKEAVL